MQYKLIENCHMENAVLGKDFNLGATSSFFHAFILMSQMDLHKFQNLSIVSHHHANNGALK
jgi:hypothetical protein